MCNVIITSRKTDIISLPTEMNRMVLKKEGQKRNTEEECDGMLLIVPDGDLKLHKRTDQFK
jgi:hypothetical protein